MSNPIVASLGDIVVSTEDVDTLDEWLNDQIIDFYFEHLSQRFSSSPAAAEGKEEADEEAAGRRPSTSGSSPQPLPPGVVFVGASASFLCAHGGASAVAGPLKLAKADLVFLPVNDNRNLNRAGGGSHWSLLVFDRDGGEGGTSGGDEESNGGEKKENNGGNSGGGDDNGKKKSDNGKASKTSSTPSSKKKNKPVFRAYDSLGYKNMLCARELSAALEEHLILDDEEEEVEETEKTGDAETEARSRRLRQRRRLDVAAARTRSVAPSRALNFVQGRCPRQGNASDCGIYILALAERIAAGRSKGLPYREIEEQLFREVTPSFAEEERERLRLLVEEIGRGRNTSGDDVAGGGKIKAAVAPLKRKKKGG